MGEGKEGHESDMKLAEEHMTEREKGMSEGREHTKQHFEAIKKVEDEEKIEIRNKKKETEERKKFIDLFVESVSYRKNVHVNGNHVDRAIKIMKENFGKDFYKKLKSPGIGGDRKYEKVYDGDGLSAGTFDHLHIWLGVRDLDGRIHTFDIVDTKRKLTEMEERELDDINEKFK